jgi:hypothetical protein
LTKNLTLVRRPGRVLQLALFFHASTNPPEEPDSVDLSFTLYTDEENSCPEKCPLTIVADNLSLSPAYVRSGATSHASGLSPGTKRERGSQSEVEQMSESKFLDLVSTNISYAQFVEIIGAKRVIVRLGTDWVELPPDQIEALRDMNRHLSRLPDTADSY